MKALEIDDSLSVAHSALGCVLCLHDWEYAAGEKELQRAVELNPSEAPSRLWYAIYHAVFTEDAEKAVAEALIATQLDPWSPVTELMVSSVYLFVEDFEQARKRAQTIVNMFPESLHGYCVLGLAYLGECLFEHAIAALEKGVAIARDPASVALLAQAYGRSGKMDKARDLTHELLQLSQEEYVLPCSLSWAYAGLHDMNSAFEWLDKAFHQRSSMVLWLRAGPMCDPLRADPRFTDLLRRLHLPA